MSAIIINSNGEQLRHESERKQYNVREREWKKHELLNDN